VARGGAPVRRGVARWSRTSPIFSSPVHVTRIDRRIRGDLWPARQSTSRTTSRALRTAWSESLPGANVRGAMTSVVVTNAWPLRVDVAVGPDNPVLHSADTSKCGFVIHR
jgi:hypothetical protein